MSIASKHAYRFEYLKSEKWNTVRLEALARERGLCEICGLFSISNDAHHIWYPDSVWETTKYHLVILCRSCHDFIHLMVPECKTGNEEAGIAMWLKFRNAIRAWRMDHIALFRNLEGMSRRTPKDLRAENYRLKEQIQRLEKRAYGSGQTPKDLRAELSRLKARISELEKRSIDRNGHRELQLG